MTPMSARARAAGRKHGILLTGMPGVGKTTVIRRVAGELAHGQIRGFTTQEIRQGRTRVGFRLETFDGQSTVLAHIDIRSPYQVGKYRVDLSALDRVVDSALLLDDEAELYLIDEIGKMECFSARFVAATQAILDSDRPVVATIGARGGGFIARAKARPDVEVWNVTRSNRDELPSQVLAWLEGLSVR